ncbi:MAG: Calx-beta domain-containing protein [Acidobacteriota bacterium]
MPFAFRCCCTLFALIFLFSTPLAAETRLIFPRITFQQGRFAGIAIANPTPTAATVTFRAYRSDGTLLAGTGVVNPRPVVIAAGQQYARVATEIFTPPASITESPTPLRLWMEVTSPVDGLTGFFLEGDSSTNLVDMDGADLVGNGTDVVLPLIENSGASTTEITALNPGSDTLTAVFDFLDVNGTVVVSQTKTLLPHAALSGPLAGFFANVAWNTVVALRVRSDRAIVCFAFVFRSSDKTMVALAAQNSTLAAKTIFFPQLAQGDDWSTSIGLSNLTDQMALVNITAYKQDGTPFGPPQVSSNPVTRAIAPHGSLRSNLRTLFGFPASPLRIGWLKAEAQAPTLGGYVEYGTATNRALVAPQLEPTTRAIFSHQAMVPPYFTGLAVLNASTLSTNVEVVSLTSDGTVTGSTQRVLKPGQHESMLIQEWIPAANGKAGGSVFVKSDLPIVATQLFGTNTFSALANVPPQRVTTAFDPTTQLAKVVITPRISVVETGKTRKFDATGSNSVTWYVNDKAGGDTQTGTVSAIGLYTAPATAPQQRTVTVRAVDTAGALAAGASVDIVQRETLVGGLTLLTAVAYLENLHRFFIAEQQILTSVIAAGAPPRATTTNTRLSEQLPTGSRVTLADLPADTVSKMLPFADLFGGSYLLAAGRDSGKIYRVQVPGGSVATVATGLSRPTSLALDVVTGDLLVAESGAGRISVVPRRQFDPSAFAATPGRPSQPGGRKSVVIGAAPRGIAVDECSGAVYVTTDAGSLVELLGGRIRTVATGLNSPGQLLILYREGLRCGDGTTVLVAETDRVLQFTPRTGGLETFVSGATGAQDLAFFPRGNPFFPGGESAVGVGQGPAGAGASQVSAVRVGTLYAEQPPTPTTPSTPSGGLLPFRDPLGDTFATAVTPAGVSVPDLVSIDAHRIGDTVIVTLVFSKPLVAAAANAPNSLHGFVDFGPTSGVGAASHALPYQPFGSDPFGVEFYVDLSTSKFVNTASGKQEPVSIEFLGEQVTISWNDTDDTVTYASMAAVVGNRFEMTDVAPNSGAIRFNAPNIGGFGTAVSVGFFLIPEFPLPEGFGPIDLPVFLHSADNGLAVSSLPVTVQYSVTGGTATRGVDYLITEGTITIPAGSPLGFFTLTLLNDTVPEGLETIIITLSSPTNVSLHAVNSVTITIYDDD